MGTVVVTTEISRKGLLDIFWSMYLKELGLPLEAKLRLMKPILVLVFG